MQAASAGLEELLSKVVARWAGIELPVVPHRDTKDVLVLGCLEPLQVPRGRRRTRCFSVCCAVMCALRLAQETRIRFSAFNQRTTPELVGRVFRVAGDLIKDQQTGLAYYMAGIEVDPTELAKLTGLKLVPGMPAEIYIKTGERTLASYLLKPLLELDLERRAELQDLGQPVTDGGPSVVIGGDGVSIEKVQNRASFSLQPCDDGSGQD